MKTSEKKFHDGQTGAAVTLAVEYGAKEARVTKILKDGTIRVALVSRAAGPAADKELLQFLAGLLGSQVKKLDILAGTDTNKLVSIVDISPEEVNQKVQSVLG